MDKNNQPNSRNKIELEAVIFTGDGQHTISTIFFDAEEIAPFHIRDWVDRSGAIKKGWCSLCKGIRKEDIYYVINMPKEHLVERLNYHGIIKVLEKPENK